MKVLRTSLSLQYLRPLFFISFSSTVICHSPRQAQFIFSLFLVRIRLLHTIAFPDLLRLCRKRFVHLLAQPSSIVLRFLTALFVEHIRSANEGTEERCTRVGRHVAAEVVGETFERSLDVPYGYGSATKIVGFVGGVAKNEHVRRKGFSFLCR
jgi:hypothetical protein